jgi:hypothetical protein
MAHLGGLSHLHSYAPLLSSIRTKIIPSLRAVNFGILRKVQLNYGRP